MAITDIERTDILWPLSVLGVEPWACRMLIDAHTQMNTMVPQIKLLIRWFMLPKTRMYRFEYEYLAVTYE